MGIIPRLVNFALAIACTVTTAPLTYATEPSSSLNTCADKNRHYSVLRIPNSHCTDPSAVNPKPDSSSKTIRTDELLEVEWLGGEILGFTVIGLTQIRGGTALLGDTWYAAAALTPTFLKPHPQYGMQLNYFAITPPFVALGLLNNYLRHDHADNARVFLSNFIGFNLGLAWARHVWRSPQHFFATDGPSNVPQLDASLFALHDSAGLSMSYQW